MSTPPPPPPAAGFSTFVEPTRRLAFAPRFSYDARWGASIVALLFGGYLLLFANLSQVAIGLSGLTGMPADQTAYLLVQYLFAIAVVVAGLAIAPATPGRRIIAIVLVLVLLVLWSLLVGGRITGAPSPVPYLLGGFLAVPSFIVPLVTALGWLIVRERPGVSYLLLLLTLLGGVIPLVGTFNGLPSIPILLVSPPIAAILGVGIAWGARAIAAAVQRMHARDGMVDPPVAA